MSGRCNTYIWNGFEFMIDSQDSPEPLPTEPNCLPLEPSNLLPLTVTPQESVTHIPLNVSHFLTIRLEYDTRHLTPKKTHPGVHPLPTNEITPLLSEEHLPPEGTTEHITPKRKKRQSTHYTPKRAKKIVQPSVI